MRRTKIASFGHLRSSRAVWCIDAVVSSCWQEQHNFSLLKACDPRKRSVHFKWVIILIFCWFSSFFFFFLGMTMVCFRPHIYRNSWSKWKKIHVKRAQGNWCGWLTAEEETSSSEQMGKRGERMRGLECMYTYTVWCNVMACQMHHLHVKVGITTCGMSCTGDYVCIVSCDMSCSVKVCTVSCDMSCKWQSLYCQLWHVLHVSEFVLSVVTCLACVRVCTASCDMSCMCQSLYCQLWHVLHVSKFVLPIVTFPAHVTTFMLLTQHNSYDMSFACGEVLAVTSGVRLGLGGIKSWCCVTIYCNFTLTQVACTDAVLAWQFSCISMGMVLCESKLFRCQIGVM